MGKGSRVGYLFVLLSGGCFGSAFLFVRVAASMTSPPILILISTTTASCGLGLLLAMRRRPLATGLRSRLRGYMLLTLTNGIAPGLLLSWGERSVTAGTAALLLATSPAWTTLLARWVTPHEPPLGRNYAGMVVAALGVLALFGPSAQTPALLGALAILAAALSFAAGNFVQRRMLSDTDSVETAFFQMLMTAIGVLPLALIAGHAATAALLPGAGYGVVSMLGTVFLLGSLDRLGAARASAYNYVAPIVSVLLGVLLLGEQMGWMTAVALLLLATGSSLMTWRPQADEPEPGRLAA